MKSLIFAFLIEIYAYIPIQPTQIPTTGKQRTRKPKKCPVGFTTGIDELGRVDESNTRKCYMKSGFK